ncbi:MAG: SpoVR family protein, partial [Myxococcota bacterium]
MGHTSSRMLREGRQLLPELVVAQQEIAALARSYSLDFFDVVYEMVTYEEMNMLAAYGGFPTRYPHWRYGMEYLEMQKSYEYGLSKIYEMVINTDPSYAYLLDNNLLVDQKLVMAHVYGHVDFFKNNLWFGHTNRKMLDQMANHATKIRGIMDRQGQTEVEAFIDQCLSIDN